jgi:hypothetical protein
MLVRLVPEVSTSTFCQLLRSGELCNWYGAVPPLQVTVTVFEVGATLVMACPPAGQESQISAMMLERNEASFILLIRKQNRARLGTSLRLADARDPICPERSLDGVGVLFIKEKRTVFLVELGGETDRRRENSPARAPRLDARAIFRPIAEFLCSCHAAPYATGMPMDSRDQKSLILA